MSMRSERDVDQAQGVAELITALPQLKELTLRYVHSDNANALAKLSSAIWSLQQLHSLTLAAVSPLQPPASGVPRPPLVSLSMPPHEVMWMGWRSHVHRHRTAQPDAVILAFADTLERLVSCTDTRTDELRCVAASRSPR